MSKKKALFLFVAAILLSFLMIQPFNLFCRTTDKCQPIILSYYLPQNAGDERYEIFFDAKDFSKDVIFEVPQSSVIVRTGQASQVEYAAKNVSDHDIKIRPTPYVYPPEAAKYVKFYECLCFREHKIKAGGEIRLSVKFKLLRAIEQDPMFQDMRAIRVGYEVK